MTMQPRQSAIEIVGVSKAFGDVAALDHVDFRILQNEFFTLLGPSGCGKTTLLRMIAGFESPSAGTILLNGRDISGLPAHKRKVNTVFQNYALFPHMTLAQNIAFGLENLRWDRARIRDRVAQMLDMVHLGALAARRPDQLSGGQRQRVALARALAPEPEVLLLDEPLSALDLKLRQSMRDELRRLQRDTGITFVFVTHDQEEALDMSDRIAVMGNGRVQQIGTPDAIYETPVNRFVADFIGETNFLDGAVVALTGDRATIRTALGDITAPHGGLTATGPATLSIRPEKIGIGPAGAGALAGQITARNYMGGYTHYTVATGGTDLRVSRGNALARQDGFGIGDMVGLTIPADAARVLPR